MNHAAFVRGLVKTANPAAIGLAVQVAAKLYRDIFLERALRKSNLANKGRFSYNDLVAAGTQYGGPAQIKRTIIPGYNNAAFVPPGMIPPSAIQSNTDEANRLLASANAADRREGQLLLASVEHSQSPVGGIIAGNRHNTQSTIAHELGHAAIENAGGINRLIQRHSRQLPSLGIGGMIGGAAAGLLGHPDIGHALIGGGIASIALGPIGNVYYEYLASKKAKQMLANPSVNQQRDLNLALQTYGVSAIAQLAGLAGGIGPRRF